MSDEWYSNNTGALVYFLRRNTRWILRKSCATADLHGPYTDHSSQRHKETPTTSDDATRQAQDKRSIAQGFNQQKHASSSTTAMVKGFRHISTPMAYAHPSPQHKNGTQFIKDDLPFYLWQRSMRTAELQINHKKKLHEQNPTAVCVVRSNITRREASFKYCGIVNVIFLLSTT